MKFITHKEMRAVDLNSEYFGVPKIELMENAGGKVFEALNSRFKLAGKKVAVFCGSGNNGGDGFVSARYLAEGGALVEVFLVGSPATPESKKNFERIALASAKIKIHSTSTKTVLGDYDIIVDALLGTGIKGELKGQMSSLVSEINRSKAFKLSVDVPTGIGCRKHVKPDLVVTFHKMKQGLEKFKTVVADIGVPKEAELYVGPGNIAVNLSERRSESRKGDNGKVLVVGGSDMYYGAPILSALGALNSGADLVYLLVPDINYEVSRAFIPDLIVRRYEGDFLDSQGIGEALKLAKSCDSMVIGPGLGAREETLEAVSEILHGVKIPAVVDADAIKALKGRKIKNSLITPHAGEFKILTGRPPPKELSKRIMAVANQAKKSNSVVLLKAHLDIIAAPDGRVKLNATGNPGMTVGGTGDVLAGVAGSFVAQGLSAFDAACCAAFVNGSAGDEPYKKKGYCFTASDLAAEIPYAIKRIRSLS